MQGLFLRRKPCKSSVFVNKITVLLTFPEMQNSNVCASDYYAVALPETSFELPLGFKEAEAYRKANGKYVRKNQWRDTTVTVEIDLD